jgi:hypothetical protein
MRRGVSILAGTQIGDEQHYGVWPGPDWVRPATPRATHRSAIDGVGVMETSRARNKEKSNGG